MQGDVLGEVAEWCSEVVVVASVSVSVVHGLVVGDVGVCSSEVVVVVGGGGGSSEV